MRYDMDMNQNLTIEQRQLLSQAQIQSLELLAMNNIELHAFLENEYRENPMLEHDESGTAPGVTEEYSHWSEGYQKNLNEGYGDRDRNESRAHARDIPAVDEDQIKPFLTEQLPIENYSAQEWKIIDVLIDSLEDSGFFCAPLEEIANLVHGDVESVRRCLEDLKQLEPFGIFSENLEECLLRQLDVMDMKTPVIEELIQNHLTEIMQGKISTVTRAMQLSSTQVRKYISFLSMLNPRPLSGFYSGRSDYVVPDILVEERSGAGWEITLNDQWIGNYQISDYYQRILKETNDEELKRYFEGKLERVRFVLKSIEQRRSTILTITGEILRRQDSYFRSQGRLLPMTMKEVAETLEIHPSTVSRALKDKYIQYRGGTVLVRSLFSKNLAVDEEAITADDMKMLIRELIDTEDKSKPYSDQKLVEILAEKGKKISRRGIAKYRDELGIAGSFQRKIVD